MKTKKRIESKWRNIIVVDDSKNETIRFQLDELAKIKNKIAPSSRIRSSIKQISLKNDIKTKTGINSLLTGKLNFIFTGNIEIYSQSNSNINIKESILNNSNDGNNEKAKKSSNIEENSLMDENDFHNDNLDNIDFKFQESFSDYDSEFSYFFNY